MATKTRENFVPNHERKRRQRALYHNTFGHVKCAHGRGWRRRKGGSIKPKHFRFARKR